MGLCLYLDTPDAARIQAEILLAHRLAAREPAGSPVRLTAESVARSLHDRLESSRWSAGYSYFGGLRAALADALGVSLADIWTGSPSAHARAGGAVALLDHSDCDGELTAHECAGIVEALAPVLAIVDEQVRDDARELVEFLARAASADATVVFA
jgi:2-keto-4-pentenoate hydratase